MRHCQKRVAVWRYREWGCDVAIRVRGRCCQVTVAAFLIAVGQGCQALPFSIYVKWREFRSGASLWRAKRWLRTCWGWCWGVAWAGALPFILHWFWDTVTERSGVVRLYLHWLHTLGWWWVTNDSGVRCRIYYGRFLRLFLCSTDCDQRPRESFTLWGFAFYWFSCLQWSTVRIHIGW